MQCVMRTCSECGVDKLEMRLKEENSNLLNENRTKYLVKQWETKREKIPATGKYRSFMHWRHDRLSNADLLNRYVNELRKMSQHSFFAAWNFHQYLVCKNNLEKGLILVVHDYAQNYLCIHQNEIQAMHWSHAQVTMHPSCISYRCPIEGCSHMVLHEIVHISADMTHNAHLAQRFQSANLEILRRRDVEIRKIKEFTDQAPSQYKNKSVFRYLAQEKIPTIRNYFSVRHGKGPCDACAGRIKRRLATLVKSEECTINSPATCFEACKKLETEWPNKNECCHYILNFNYTGKIAKQPDTSK